MDLLLTVATLFVAIYSVVPRNRQLDLSLHLGSLDWIVLTVGSLFVIEALRQGGTFRRSQDDRYRLALSRAFAEEQREYEIKFQYHEFVSDLASAVA